MRRLFTMPVARAAGLTHAAVRWGEEAGRWRRVMRGVYGDGPEPPTALDRSRAQVLASGGFARGPLAGVPVGLEGVRVDDGPDRCRRPVLGPLIEVGGFPCTDGLDTLIDLAAVLDDERWEQALESALRQRLTTVEAVEATLPELGRARARGTTRMRRVQALRPSGAPATESLLETLFVQLAREVPGLGPPDRQVLVDNVHGTFLARVDVVWRKIGLFIELDGQQHKDQPVYDARRETAVVAATGWLCGRFTWREVVHLRRTTVRRLADLADQARERPLPPAS